MAKSLFRKIIVAVNGSKASLHAAMYGIIMAKTYNLELKFVYVIDVATMKQLTLSKFFVSGERDEYEQDLTSDGKKYLDYVSSLAKAKGIKPETELVKGAVWTEIIKAADNFKADFILIGGREEQRSYSSTGSVFKNVIPQAQSETIAASHCSVIVVKQKDIEQLFNIF